MLNKIQLWMFVLLVSAGSPALMFAEQNQPALACEVDPKNCDADDLCKKATYGSSLKVWYIFSKQIYVDAAQARGLDCGVGLEVVKPEPVKTCEEDPKNCDGDELCKKATYGSSLKVWYRFSGQVYVDAAQARGLDCGVGKATTFTKASYTCEDRPAYCDNSQLCEAAIARVDNAVSWSSDPKSRPYVEEAKRRNLTCGAAVENQTVIASDAQCNESAAELKNQLSAAHSALASQKKSCDGDISQLQANLSLNYVDIDAYTSKVEEVAALNAAIADLTESRDSGTVPRNVYDSQAEQLAAANQALADLNKKISSEYVSSSQYNQKLKEIEVLNNSLVDLQTKHSNEYFALQTKLTKDYIERSIYYREVNELSAQVAALNSSLTEQKELCEAELTSQVSALNSAIVDTQSRSEIVKRRLSECQISLQAFTMDCKANVECASVMGMQE
jgi:chromosome segregation ATPase